MRPSMQAKQHIRSILQFRQQFGAMQRDFNLQQLLQQANTQVLEAGTGESALAAAAAAGTAAALAQDVLPAAEGLMMLLQRQQELLAAKLFAAEAEQHLAVSNLKAVLERMKLVSFAPQMHTMLYACSFQLTRTCRAKCSGNTRPYNAARTTCVHCFNRKKPQAQAFDVNLAAVAAG